MKVEKLEKEIQKNPLNFKGSTARMKAAHGTLYMKRVKGVGYLPLLTFCGEFIVDWKTSLYSEIDNTRSRNMVESTKQKVKRGWLESLVTTNTPNADGNDSPAPCMDLLFSDSNNIIQSPGPVSAKSLMMGIHPETGTVRQEWDLSPLDYRDGFQKPFEKLVSQLAWGTICRENALRDSANTVGALKQEVDTLAGRAVEEMEQRKHNVFAPLGWDEAGNSEPHLKKLQDRMVQLGERCTLLGSAAEEFGFMCGMPDAYRPGIEQRKRDWKVRYDNKVADQSLSYYSDNDDVYKERGVELNASRPQFTLSYGSMTLIDWNVRSFSYYWVQKRFYFYQKLLSRFNCFVGDLFGLAPSDWNYTELAAPIFLKHKEENK